MVAPQMAPAAPNLPRKISLRVKELGKKGIDTVCKFQLQKALPQ